MPSRLTILGSGMGGLGAAEQARNSGVEHLVFEAKRTPGGHTCTHTSDGFVFDEGPHVSFTKNDRIKNIFSQAIDGKYQSIDAYIDNYWQGHWIRHPVVTNMHGLPSRLVTDIIRDYVEVRQNQNPTIKNYEDWLVASYGRKYAETFPMKYTEKYHTTPARNLTTEWVGPRLYQAKLDEVLFGALSAERPNIHYVQDYRYPTHGGFAAFLDGLIRKSNIATDHQLIALDPRARELRFANGKSASYERIVSSIPLPDLIPMIAGAPKDVVEAASLLACSTVVLVNLGLDRPDISKASWNYYYDEEFPFSRVSYPRNMSPYTSPEGTGTIQAEVYFSKKYKPLRESPQAWIDPVIDGLRRCGVIRESDKIIFKDAMVIPYANIIFDLDRPAALAKVHGFLDDVGIGYCGRYGEWGYLWSDEAFLSGETAAQKALARAAA